MPLGEDEWYILNQLSAGSRSQREIARNLSKLKVDVDSESLDERLDDLLWVGYIKKV